MRLGPKLAAAALTLTATWMGATSANASPSAVPEAKPEPSPSRHALAVTTAVFPGIIVHGTGHYVAGRPAVGRKLLVAEGIGLSAFLAGGVPIFLTGASRYVVGPAAALAAAGFGVFAISFLADVYGTATSGHGTGRALRTAPTLESELGYRYVYDPQYRYRNFMVEALDFRFSKLRIAPSAWFAMDDGNLRLRALLALRVLGSTPSAPSRDGSFIDIESALTHHRYDSESFSSVTGELAANGRLDLQRLDGALRGSFAELGVGLALQALDYEVAGLEFAEDVETLLLSRFAFGMYLGDDPARRGGELSVYYDHRHDGYTAGLKLTGIGSGVVGHFGLAGKYFFDENWGVRAEVEAGSAYVVGLSALFRHGALE